jgi:WD40 repeat protein
MKALQEDVGHSTVVSAVAMHQGSQLFFSGDWAGRLSAWEPYDADVYGGVYDQNLADGGTFISKRKRVLGARSDKSGIENLVVSSDGEKLLVGDQQGRIELWQVRGFVKRAEVKAHKGLVRELRFAPDNSRLASLGRDGRIVLWEISDLIKEGELASSKLKKAAEFELPQARSMTFFGLQTLVVGLGSGAIVDLDLGDNG